MKTKLMLFLTMLSLTLFIGCSSNESVSTDPATNAITSDDVIANSEIDATLDDVSLIAEDQFSVQQSVTSKISATAKTSAPIKSILPLCATITTVLTNDTYTRTIDFGTDGCAMPNGNIVKGKIIISFSKSTTSPLKTISYTLVGFYHNGKLVEGNKTITVELKSTDLLAALHPVSTHSIDVKITNPDGKVYTRIGTRVREMVEGFATVSEWSDNVFLIWGYNITTFPNGNKYTSTIETPLRITMNCGKPFPVSGVITIVKNDKEATLDYGNGECDNLATITINGVIKEIKIRK